MRIGNLMNAESRLFHAHAEGARDRLLDNLVRKLGLEGNCTTDEVCGIEIAEHNRGISDRRRSPALAVARRPWIGASRLRPDTQAAARVDPGNGAATGTERRYVEHWYATAYPAILASGRTSTWPF